jgi:PAS domain-containing protein
MSPIETILRQCGLSAGIGFWRFDGTRGMIHWPRGFGPARDESYGSWWRLGDFGQAFEASERAKVFDYFEAMFEDGRPTVALEVAVNGADGRIRLRVEGAPIEGVDGLLAGGLVRNVSRRYEAEDRAKSLGQILDALMGSVQSGVVVLDGQARVRRANARALQLFDLVPREGLEAASFAAFEARLPADMQRELRAAQIVRAAASGAVSKAPHLAEPINWAANPWGRGGMVLVLRTVSGPGKAAAMATDDDAAAAGSLVTSVRPDQHALVAAAVARSRAMLDYVHHACLVIQSRDASIDFANRAARDKLGLKPGVRTHINNLFEISGRHAPRHTYVTPERVGAIVTLPMGARVTRMVDVDPDWLFVEYV